MILLRNPRWAADLGPGASTLEELRALPLNDDVLIAFSTGVIVPPDILGRVRAAYNFHAASPDYPGRDPHHWAVYERAESFGATCHVMTERVDEGPIIRVLRFPLRPDMTPAQVRDRAEQTALTLYRDLLPSLLDGSARPCGETWTGPKRTRKDFLAICNVPSDANQEEINRRIFAFSMPGHDNVKVNRSNDGDFHEIGPTPSSDRPAIKF